MGFVDCLKKNLKDALADGLKQYADGLDLSEDDLNKILEDGMNDLRDGVATLDIKSQALAETLYAEKEIDRLFNEGHDVQEATRSVKFTEQLMSETYYTKPAEFQDCDYTTNTNYPHRYGHIDTVKNWWLVDKKDRYAEAVHSSGSLFHIDRDGNVSIHITGGLKLIVDKDISIEGRGSADTVIKGNFYRHVCKDQRVVVNDNIYQINGGSRTYETTGSVSVSSSGSISSKSLASTNISASKINLNRS